MLSLNTISQRQAFGDNDNRRIKRLPSNYSGKGRNKTVAKDNLVIWTSSENGGFVPKDVSHETCAKEPPESMKG